MGYSWTQQHNDAVRERARRVAEAHTKRLGIQSAFGGVYCDTFYHDPENWQTCFVLPSSPWMRRTVFVPIDCTKDEAFINDIADWAYAQNYDVIVATENLPDAPVTKEMLDDDDFYRNLAVLHP